MYYLTKGKVYKKYKFGNKVSLVPRSLEGFIVGALNLESNPYDGYALQQTKEQIWSVVVGFYRRRYLWIRGYRGHYFNGRRKVYFPGQNRKRRMGFPSTKFGRKRTSVISSKRTGYPEVI